MNKFSSWLRDHVQKSILLLKRTLLTPPTGRIDHFSYRWMIIGVIVTGSLGCWAIHIARTQLVTQLQELNSKAIIELRGHFTEMQASSIGPESTTPINFHVIPRNSGKYNSGNWVATLIFCKNVKLLKNDPSWKQSDGWITSYHSLSPVLNEQSFFSDALDTVGSFDITLPGTNYYSWNDPIPVTRYTVYGERAIQVNEIIFYDPLKKSFFNKPLLTRNGKLLTDEKGCGG